MRDRADDRRGARAAPACSGSPRPRREGRLRVPLPGSSATSAANALARARPATRGYLEPTVDLDGHQRASRGDHAGARGGARRELSTDRRGRRHAHRVRAGRVAWCRTGCSSKTADRRVLPTRSAWCSIDAAGPSKSARDGARRPSGGCPSSRGRRATSRSSCRRRAARGLHDHAVEIEDGDSPRAGTSSARARRRSGEPAIVFTSSRTCGAHTLRFGGARALACRVLRPRGPIASELGLALLARLRRLPEAAARSRCATTRASRHGPALAFAMEPGPGGRRRAASATPPTLHRSTGARGGPQPRVRLPAERGGGAGATIAEDLRVGRLARRAPAAPTCCGQRVSERREIDVIGRARPPSTSERLALRDRAARRTSRPWVSGLELRMSTPTTWSRDYEVRGIDGAGRWQTLARAGAFFRALARDRRGRS